MSKLKQEKGFFQRLFERKEKVIYKDELVEKLRKVAELIGDDINVGLKITKDKCQIAAIMGANTGKELLQAPPADKKDLEYIG